VISICFDPFRSTFLSSDLQHTDVKFTVIQRLMTVETNFFYARIQILVI